MILEFTSPDPAFRVTFEDDGRVAYAYLRKDGVIVGDVWLYNRGITPQQPEWDSKERAPFANAAPFVADGGRVTHPINSSDVLVDWETSDYGPVAYIYIFEDLYGVIGEGDKPGYARFAIRDGPLARVMVIEEVKKTAE